MSPRVPHKCPFLRKEADISCSLWSSNWPSPRQQNRAVTSCRLRPIRSFESCASGALTRLTQWQDLGLVFQFVHQHFPEPGATAEMCQNTCHLPIIKPTPTFPFPGCVSFPPWKYQLLPSKRKNMITQKKALDF